MSGAHVGKIRADRPNLPTGGAFAIARARACAARCRVMRIEQDRERLSQLSLSRSPARRPGKRWWWIRWITRCACRGRRRWDQITQIVNTHEHTDHTGGNEPMRARPERCCWRTIAPGSDCRHRSRAVGRRCHSRRQDGRAAGARHAGPHDEPRLPVCRGDGGGLQSALICGDTLFNAGAGNCHHGGDPRTSFTAPLSISWRSCPTTRGSTPARLHRAQPGLHAGSRARQRRRPPRCYRRLPNKT